MADMKFQSFVLTVCGYEFSLEIAILTVNYTMLYHTEDNNLLLTFQILVTMTLPLLVDIDSTVCDPLLLPPPKVCS